MKTLSVKSLTSRCFDTSASDYLFMQRNMDSILGYFSNAKTQIHSLTNLFTTETRSKSNAEKIPYESVRRRRKRRIHRIEKFKGKQLPYTKAGRGFHRPDGNSRRWIDSNMWSQIDRNNPTTLPKRINEIRRRDIRDSDEQAKTAYRTPNRRMSRYSSSLFASGAISAAREMGIITPDLKPYLKPLSIRNSVNKIVKNTNSGYPYFKRKNTEEPFSDTVNWIRQLFDSVTNRKIFTSYVRPVEEECDSALLKSPLYIFHRFQISPTDIPNEWNEKVRQVWCSPMRIVALESMFFSNIIDKAINYSNTTSKPVYCTGKNNRQISSGTILRLFRNCHSSINKFLFGGDFEKYDRSFLLLAYDLFFGICEWIIIFPSSKHKHIYNLLRIYSKYTPFFYAGFIYFMARGLVSGSLITNFIGTFWNLCLWHCNKIIMHNKEVLDLLMSRIIDIFTYDFSYLFDSYTYTPREDLTICSDDVLICTTVYETLVFTEFCRCLGIVITFSDPVKDTPIYYLGRYWLPDGRPWQTEEYMSAHIVYRTKYYKIDEVDFDIEKLDLYRVLSICLPFCNGLSYLEKTFKGWEPYEKFKANREGFYFLKEWPNDNYEYISYDEAIQLGTL